MIRRFYVHNFRCLENFELPLSDHSSVLLIGKNGSGKSTVAFALEILQKIARGTNRVADLVKPKDLSRGRGDVPMRFEIEVELDNQRFEYAIALELPAGFRELRILEEKLIAGGEVVYTRESAKVRLAKKGAEAESVFPVDWHLVALPIVQERAAIDPLHQLKQWLRRMLILRPIPALIDGSSSEELLQPNHQVSNFGDWFTGLMTLAPAAYSRVDELIKRVMPDFKSIQNPVIAKDARSLEIHFANNNGTLKIAFEDLSDGEKCFMIWAVTVAANEAYGPLFCFWDEPDNYLGVSEVGNITIDLRREFEKQGQLFVTSHNPEAIRRFSDENTFVLSRRSHLEPTVIRKLGDLEIQGDLVNALIRGDVEDEQ